MLYYFIFQGQNGSVKAYDCLKIIVGRIVLLEIYTWPSRGEFPLQRIFII